MQLHFHRPASRYFFESDTVCSLDSTEPRISGCFSLALTIETTLCRDRLFCDAWKRMSEESVKSLICTAKTVNLITTSLNKNFDQTGVCMAMASPNSEKLLVSPKDSHWLSLGPSTNNSGIDGKCVVKIKDTKTNGHPSHKSLVLNKPMSEYTLEDIPQICEEIAELFSDILGPLL